MLGISAADDFLGSPNRPNLVYKVVPKPDTAKATLKEMVGWIRTHFPEQCGIVYCLSRKDAEEVAQQLGEQATRPSSLPLVSKQSSLLCCATLLVDLLCWCEATTEGFGGASRECGHCRIMRT